MSTAAVLDPSTDASELLLTSDDTDDDLLFDEQVEAEHTLHFNQLALPAALLRACADLGFQTPTAIQAEAIPALLGGRDITGVAQTGTGKTAAFGLPLLASIDPRSRGVQALVLTPTRELAVQVAEAISSFAVQDRKSVV